LVALPFSFSFRMLRARPRLRMLCRRRPRTCSLRPALLDRPRWRSELLIWPRPFSVAFRGWGHQTLPNPLLDMYCCVLQSWHKGKQSVGCKHAEFDAEGQAVDAPT
jgi:hypothetical protein